MKIFHVKNHPKQNSIKQHIFANNSASQQRVLFSIYISLATGEIWRRYRSTPPSLYASAAINIRILVFGRLRPMLI